MTGEKLGWFGIVRLGLVQASLGAVVVLTTSTLNRVMVVEFAIPAAIPGALVGWHYAVQLLRPRWGFGSDANGRRTPWIIGGMAVLAIGGSAAAVATALLGVHPILGVALAVVAFSLVGIGVGAAGTTLLVMLAKRVDEARRAASATIVWVMMIAGFVVTSAVAGSLLDPFSPARLVVVAVGVCSGAFVLAAVAMWRLEGQAVRRPAAAMVVDRPAPAGSGSQPGFLAALAQVWREPQARRFSVFVFVSMLAYGGEDLILEPFAGSVLGFTPGESAKLSAVQHGGVLVGMLVFGFAASLLRRWRGVSLQAWTIGGCIASALLLVSMAGASTVGLAWPLRPTVFLLGSANGAYAVAAIGSMMALVGAGRPSREGVRMGFWGAAQALAFGLGGLSGTLANDLAHACFNSSANAYSAVFIGEALVFLMAAILAVRVSGRGAVRSDSLSPSLATAEGSS